MRFVRGSATMVCELSLPFILLVFISPHLTTPHYTSSHLITRHQASPRVTITKHCNADILYFSEDTATVIVHAFTMTAYGTALLGGYISDAILGKFKTIFYVSMVLSFYIWWSDDVLMT